MDRHGIGRFLGCSRCRLLATPPHQNGGRSNQAKAPKCATHESLKARYPHTVLDGHEYPDWTVFG